MSARAESLWEELGGDLCICQRADVWHWCENCQRKIALIDSALLQAAAPPAPTAEPDPRCASHHGNDGRCIMSAGHDGHHINRDLKTWGGER